MVYRGRTFGVRINVADRVQKLPMLPMLPLFVVISRIRQIRHVLGLNVAGVATHKKNWKHLRARYWPSLKATLLLMYTIIILMLLN